MKRRQFKFNPKRRFLAEDQVEALAPRLLTLAREVRYGGNPEHKKSGGDFNLTPPASARPAKSLCDDAKITQRSLALELLCVGLRSGFVSDRFEGEWPYNVWGMSKDGVPLEAQWEGEGVYHGYPMPDEDPFVVEVRRRCGGV